MYVSFCTHECMICTVCVYGMLCVRYVPCDCCVMCVCMRCMLCMFRPASKILVCMYVCMTCFVVLLCYVWYVCMYVMCVVYDRFSMNVMYMRHGICACYVTYAMICYAMCVYQANVCMISYGMICTNVRSVCILCMYVVFNLCMWFTVSVYLLCLLNYNVCILCMEVRSATICYLCWCMWCMYVCYLRMVCV